MLLKFIVVLLLLAILFSLFSGLFFMFRDRDAVTGKPDNAPTKQRTVRALTVRIALSLVLFAVLTLGYHWGWYSPGGH